MQKAIGLIGICLFFWGTALPAQDTNNEQFALLWKGNRTQLTVEEIAAYCAPVFWFSPDEPELKNKKGREIDIPAPFPFDTLSSAPVVYYQIKEILAKENAREPIWNYMPDDISKSVIYLDKIKGFQINYMHYYRHEAGVGRHEHDTEQVQFKIYVHRSNPNGDKKRVQYELVFLQATATAHIVDWYKNIYSLDTTNFDFELKLPFHILVEEGKHASCTDMNGDGYYTPGYDVNVRVNDAWGLRDVIRTGTLFSSQFQGWMTKVRRPEYRVLPPLPADSPLRSEYEQNTVYAPDNAVYELRPMPDPDHALPDAALKRDMEPYHAANWPRLRQETDYEALLDWWEGDRIIKSLSIAVRANETWGLSFSFPLLIIKNVEAPLIGGWLVNRVYFQDKDLRDFGYNILYTPSASRFMDPYFAFGVEVDYYNVPETEALKKRTDFVMETGVKFRTTVKPTILSFLSPITDFWGVRIGIKNRGFMKIDQLTYVFEIGAGAW
ncbi:MAG TPA: hypothetical protein ENK44_08855 [Caldithrix abyssi]|uniref:Uncharacterized protein n=1 Tax=Caldithrix abyssi TaxID=187145 RepID=A0A7V4U1Y7_CALAY|nr:hypothetical protein [Caldithrix abyssi]